MKKISLHISPCPNDTFAFDAIINNRIEHDFDLAVEYHDIEELNEGVLRGEPDISKISYAVYPLVADKYRLLDSGSALGRGNGQLLVRRKGETGKIRTVASPGKNTTANALLVRYFPDVEEVRQMLFSEIAEAVEFLVDEHTLHCGAPLKQIKLREIVLLVSISHGKGIEIPNGDSCFHPGDTVVVVVRKGTVVLQLNDIFEH